jgi:hypothetical protein
MSRIACLHIPQLQTAAQPQHELLNALISCSPKAQALEPNIIILDASGLTLRGGESTFCHQILKTCNQVGFGDVYIGIADNAFTANVASCSGKRRITIISPGKDAEFLAPLSIKYLKLAANIEDTLITLGITTMGELAAMPIDSLNERFCKAGEIIWPPWQLAQGIDSCKPTAFEPEKRYECFLDLGGAVSTYNEIVFALKSMLDRLTIDLKEAGMQAQELVLSLYHESNKFDERTLELIRPNYDSKFLLEIIRLSLTAGSLTQELTAIKLCVSKYTREEWGQTALELDSEFRRGQCNRPMGGLHPPLQNPELLLLQRFAARWGKDKIFTAKAVDQYVSENAGVWISVGVDCIDPRADTISPYTPPDTNYINSKIKDAAADLVLRPIIPSARVLVKLEETKPTALNYKKCWYKIKSITEPEYLSCQWWNQSTAKYYYKVLVENNQQLLLMLLVYDQLKNTWCVEGLYD